MKTIVGVAIIGIVAFLLITGAIRLRDGTGNRKDRPEATAISSPVKQPEVTASAEKAEDIDTGPVEDVKEQVNVDKQQFLTDVRAAMTSGDFHLAKSRLDLLLAKDPSLADDAEVSQLVGELAAKLDAVAAIEKQRNADALQKMHRSLDVIDGSALYTSPGFYASSGSRSKMLLTIGTSESYVFLTLDLGYEGDDWIFVDSYTISAGGKQFEIDPDYDDISRHAYSGSVTEDYFGSVDRNELNMLRAVLTSPGDFLRYHGEEYAPDVFITHEDKQDLRLVLRAYLALGGKLDDDFPLDEPPTTTNLAQAIIGSWQTTSGPNVVYNFYSNGTLSRIANGSYRSTGSYAPLGDDKMSINGTGFFTEDHVGVEFDRNFMYLSAQGSMLALERISDTPPDEPVRIPTAQPPSVTTAVANADANLRAGPGTDYPVSGGLKAGETLSIRGKNPDGTWYQLQDNNWIAAFLVSNAPVDLPVVPMQ